MERTKSPKSINLPDAINCSLTRDFTQVPTNLLRNPNITSKAKAILCLLLSNKEGWKSHLSTIRGMMKEGTDAIQSGLQELEKHGYLTRIKYRSKKTKIWKGSFWAYTDIPKQFNITEQLKILENKGLEPQLDFPVMGKPGLENPDYNNINIKKTNNKEKNNKKVELQQFLKLFPKEWQDNHTFQNSLEDFVIHRRQKGSLLTPIARNRIANKLIKHDLQTVINALDLSVENGWTGVFPESIKLSPNNSSKKSPKEIVYEYFEGKRDELYIESFYKTYCKDAEDLLADRSDGQCSVLAENMMALHQWIEENQTNTAKENPVIPNASVLLGYYVDWLEKQNWLTIEPRHFTPNDKIFRSKFLTWENDYIGLNVMTGKF